MVTLGPIFDFDTSSSFRGGEDEPLRAAAHDDAQCDDASRRRGIQDEQRHRLPSGRRRRLVDFKETFDLKSEK